MALRDFVDLAERYVRMTQRRRRAGNVWPCILQTVADSGALAIKQKGGRPDPLNIPRAFAGLMARVPTPQAAAAACRSDAPLRGLRLQQPAYAAKTLCLTSKKVEEIAEAVLTCDQGKLRQLRREGHLFGFGNKSIDMLLQNCGCPVPVVDVWEIRNFDPTVDRNTAARWVQREQATEVYDLVASHVRDLARREGLPPNTYHVARWMTSVFPDRDAAALFTEAMEAV